MDQQGVAWATATSYGNTITYTPEDSAARAFDGDVDTAWRAGAFGAAIGQAIRVDLDDAITTDHVNLVQPINGPRDRYITKVKLRFDGGRPGRRRAGRRRRVPRPVRRSRSRRATSGGWRSR